MTKQALEGVKVLDFTWALAGPCGTKVLVDQGATLVKIESMSGVCVTRTFGPMAGGVRGINRTGYFAIYNNNKYSMALDLHLPQGREIAKKLVAWSDIVIENFRPGAMEKWGLGYDDLKQVKSDIIMIRSSMHGQTGPTAARPGWGTHLQAESGFFHFLGYPGGEPLVHPGFTDFTAAWYLAIAAVGAINYRRKTGKGMYIDVSNYETGATFLGPALLDYTANKRVQTRMGNRHLEVAPHGAYRCKGDDRWCVIAVFNDAEWCALAKAMGNPELAKDTRFTTQQMRKQNEDELDGMVEAWTVNYSPQEVMTKLQAVGVAAGVVQDGRDLDNDPQLAHRQHYIWLKHSEMGLVAFEAPSYRFTKTPFEMRPSPCLGEHTEYVCREFLGMSDEEFLELIEAGVLQ